MANSFSYRQHAGALLALGLPLIGSHLAQLAIGITDSLMLGWYSATALAAATLATSLFFVIFIVGSGFAFAVLPMVANAVAAGADTQVRRITRMGLWASTLFGLVMIPPMIWSEPILLAIGQDPEIAALAADYLRITSFGLIPALFVMVLRNYLSALERTGFVLVGAIIAAIFNAAFNWVLIFGNLGAPELGLRGAAITSASVQFLSLGIFALYIRRTRPEHALFQRLWRIDREALARVFRVGWPIGLTNLAESGMFSASAVMMGWVGKLPLAAHGVALQLASISFVVHLGMSQAATVRVGKANTKNNKVDMRRGAASAALLSFLFSIVTIIVFLVFKEPLVGLFLGRDEPDRDTIIAIGASLLVVAALFQLVDGAQVIALGLLRGLEDTRVPMVYAAVSYWGIGLPCSYVLGIGFGWGGIGVWLGLVAGLTMASVLLGVRFWRRVQ